MDIKTLEAFLVLADHLNFTKSAEQIYISQPAFSRQISKLEDEFGCPLFVRNKRQVELTPYGKAFAKYAHTIYDEYRNWIVQLQHMKDQTTSQLTIGFLRDLPQSYFPGVIPDFKAKYPDIAMSFVDCDMSDIFEKLMKEEIDIAFSISQAATDFGDIASLTISTLPMCVVLPKDHKYANAESLKIVDLKDEQFIAVNPQGYNQGTRHLLAMSKLAGFEPKISGYASFVPSMIMMVGFGMGITVVADPAKVFGSDQVTFVPLDDPGAFLNIMLLWRTNSSNHATGKFINLCKELLDQLPPPSK
ncbi:MAG: LysR family transcriptional regulator [Clostridiales Family XIII bacterium]|jgi:DNA-binding transcriptional LysR family regulator|nr:LysR family transcriptional regulator [Clostridiales Family XIII bacterium]